ncbi:hypothetical protein Tsubulata_028527 [Turnera subulata]|uniref:RING-type domain-containing protein n=1 Tax=Turnera subulata TaxID=218843 RepID=A0A9Q0FG29_9ROSI|nr:hypothetical protein Tsubulata_028527 [Turnera subulata]
MAIRFKFRSSPHFDSVDIQGRPSISVSDLKSMILRHGNLRVCEDFDLVFSDAASGQEYSDDKSQIPSGSSVIIKRVPAGSGRLNTPPIAALENVRTNETNAAEASPPVNVGTHGFDDFGVDLSPVLRTTMCGSDLDAVVAKGKTNTEVPRFLKTPLVECRKIEASDLSEAFSSGSLDVGFEGDVSRKKLELDIKEHLKLEKLVGANPKALDDAKLPSELKCSLCHTFFKEAVMIPCCQHSFCLKCIHPVLVKKEKCPKCFSSKCRAEDLLPNISLRQAIERFINSGILLKSSDNAIDQYAPDGESGIHGNDVSDAVTIHQRGDLCYCSSATGRGSNQIVEEPVGGKLAALSHKLEQTDGENHGYSHPADFQRCPETLNADCQGENQLMHEAESTLKRKRAEWVDTEDRRFMETEKHRKVGHTCFLCGSPDHLVRACPAAMKLHPMHQSGNAMFLKYMPSYVPHCWNVSSFPRPFLNPYGSPGMVPFNAAMLPNTSFPHPTCIPSMVGGLGHMASYRGYGRLGGMPTQVEVHPGWHLYHPGVLQGPKKQQKLPNEKLSGHSFAEDDYTEDSLHERYHHNGAERSHDSKSRDKDEHVSFVKERFSQRSHWKHSKYSHHHHDKEMSSSEVEDVSYGSGRHSEDPQDEYFSYSKKYGGRTEQRGSDSIRSRSFKNCNDSTGIKRRNDKHDRRKSHSQSESSFEPSLSREQKTRRRRKDSSCGSRHSRRNIVSLNDDLSDERWQMVSGPDEDYKEDHHYYKRKRH